MDPPAAKVEHADQGLRTVEAEGASRDHAQLVVESFDDAVGEPLLELGDDVVEVLADDACRLHERLEL